MQKSSLLQLVNQSPIRHPQLVESLELSAFQRRRNMSFRRRGVELLQLFPILPSGLLVQTLQLLDELVEVENLHDFRERAVLVK